MKEYFIEDTKKLYMSYMFIEKFIDKIIIKYKNKDFLGPEIILYLSDIIDTEFESKELLNICNDLIKKNLANINNYCIYSIGMISELGVLTYSINTINKKTGELAKLSNKLNNLLLDLTYARLEYIRSQPVVMNHYDCVSGISGIVYYLLNENIHLENLDSKKLDSLKEYLIWLTLPNKNTGNKLLNIHIEKDNLPLKEERELYNEGLTNFSLSHGIMGPMMALYRLYIRNKEETVKQQLTFLYNLYKKFQKEDDNYIFFPSKLSKQDYENKYTCNYFVNYSWCYGDISILICMLKISKELNYINDFINYSKIIKEIFNKRLDFYNLKIPTICHGYSSLIMEQYFCYKFLEEDIVLKTFSRNLEALFINYNRINRIFKNNKKIIFKNGYLKNEIQGYSEDLSFLNGVGGIFLTNLDIITNKGFYGDLLMIWLYLIFPFLFSDLYASCVI